MRTLTRRSRKVGGAFQPFDKRFYANRMNFSITGFHAYFSGMPKYLTKELYLERLVATHTRIYDKQISSKIFPYFSYSYA